MPRSIFFCNEGPKLWIIWVYIPTVVVPELLTCVVRRVCQNQIDLAAILIKSHHRLKVLALEQKIFALLSGRPHMQARFAPHHPGSDLARNLLSRTFTMERYRDPVAQHRFHQPSQVISVEQIECRSFIPSG